MDAQIAQAIELSKQGQPNNRLPPLNNPVPPSGEDERANRPMGRMPQPNNGEQSNRAGGSDV